MKNLKRALSFALASVMLIGMMAVGASANKEFTDAEQIDHDNAVDTLVALNVISGKEDGSYFAPEDVVTRGEMAKMVTVALNGGKDPVLNTNPVATYTDIKGHWAEKYIEYCVSLGIVSGRGDGTFDPYGTVTGVEAAKMMLVAQGWDSKIFGFTGNAWAANVNLEANKVKLYDGLEDIEPSEGLTRDNAAQLIYNGILANTMVKNPSMEITGEDITWTYQESGISIFERNYNGKIWIGTFDANDKTDPTLSEGSINVNGALEDTYKGAGDDDNDPTNFPSDFDIQFIGEEVKVLFKDGTAGTPNTPDGKDTIYGVFTTGGTSVVDTTVDKINEDYDKDDKVEIDDQVYVVAAEPGNIVINYEGTGDPIGDQDDIEELNAPTGDTVKLILNDKGEINAVYVVKSTLAAVTALNSEKITMNANVGTVELKNAEVYEGVAKGDVVVVTTLYNSDPQDEDAFTIVEKAEVITGTVNGFKNTEKVTVDGTVYGIYDETPTMLTAIPDVTAAKANFVSDHIGEEFDLYMVNGYVGAAVQITESASNYSVVLSISNDEHTPGHTFNSLQIQVMDAEGTKTVLTVNDDSVDGTGETDVAIEDGGDFAEGDLVVWTGTADDATVTLVEKWANADEYSYSDKAKAFDGKTVATNAVLFAETAYDNDNDTPITFGDDQKVKAYALRGLDDLTDVTATYVTKDGKVVAVVVDLDDAPDGATDTTVYGIVSANNGTVKIDDTPYVSYTVENDTESFTVNVPNTGTATIAVGKLVSFEPTSDDTYAHGDITALVPGALVEAGYVKEFNSGDNTLTYFTATDGDEGEKVGVADSAVTIALADDCYIAYVNVDDDEAGSDIGINAFDSVTGYMNVLVVKNSDGDELKAIIVETSNEADITAPNT